MGEIQQAQLEEPAPAQCMVDKTFVLSKLWKNYSVGALLFVFWASREEQDNSAGPESLLVIFFFKKCHPYVKNCAVCAQSKSSNQFLAGPLQPLPIPCHLLQQQPTRLVSISSVDRVNYLSIQNYLQKPALGQHCFNVVCGFNLLSSPCLGITLNYMWSTTGCEEAIKSRKRLMSTCREPFTTRNYRQITTSALPHPPARPEGMALY